MGLFKGINIQKKSAMARAAGQIFKRHCREDGKSVSRCCGIEEYY